MEGLLCKECFDKKEEEHDKKKNFCAICGGKMGLIRYNPKSKNGRSKVSFAEIAGMKRKQSLDKSGFF